MLKTAPISQLSSLMDYQVTLCASREHSTVLDFSMLIPVKSLCPASKAIADYGAHSQRAYIKLSSVWQNNICWEKVIELVEAQASAPLYSLLKRVDEKLPNMPIHMLNSLKIWCAILL
jgi:GTP cyclohydrolase IB